MDLISTTVIILVLIIRTGLALVCHECGIPGATSCKDADMVHLALATNCSIGSCAFSSFTYMSGRREEARFCHTPDDVLCSPQTMNVDSCHICSTDFCNGPLPTCEQQLRFGVSPCVTRPGSLVTAWVLGSIFVLALLTVAIIVARHCVQKRRKMPRRPMVASYTTALTTEQDGMLYSQL